MSQAIQTLFVVGVPRSGTTLLTRLLSGTAGHLAMSEPFFVRSVVGHWRLKRYFSRVSRDAALSWAPPPPKNAGDVTLLNYMEGLARGNGFSTLIVKETFRVATSWANVALLDAMRSKHPVVAIIRDPFDVAASSIRAFRLCRGVTGRLLRHWAPGLPLFSSDRELVEYVGHNWSHFADWCAASATITISYEDLVNDPRPQLEALCDLCRIRFDEAMIEGRRQDAFGGIGDPGVVHRPRQVDNRSIGRRDELGRELGETLLKTCGKRMSKLSYL